MRRLRRASAIGRQTIPHIRKVLAELGKEVVRCHAGLGRHALHLLLTESAVQLLRRDRLIGTISTQGLNGVTQARLLEG